MDYNSVKNRAIDLLEQGIGLNKIKNVILEETGIILSKEMLDVIEQSFKEKKDCQTLEELIKEKDYDKAIELSFEMEESAKLEPYVFASQRLTAFLRKRELVSVVKQAISLEKKYPENGHVFRSQKISAFIIMHRYKEVLKETRKAIEKYPKSKNVFLSQRLIALYNLGELEKALDGVNELLTNDVSKSEKESLYVFRLKVLKGLNRNKEVLEESKRLQEKYPFNKAILKYKKASKKASKRENNNKDKKESQYDIDYAKKFISIVRMSEKEFLEYAKKNLGEDERIFMLTARYKAQKNNTMASETLKEYKKRFKEQANNNLIKKVSNLLKDKATVIKIDDWIKVAEKLNLNFDETTVKNRTKRNIDAPNDGDIDTGDR